MDKYIGIYMKQVIFHKAYKDLVVFYKRLINNNKNREEGKEIIPLFYWYEPG